MTQKMTEQTAEGGKVAKALKKYLITGMPQGSKLFWDSFI